MLPRLVFILAWVAALAGLTLTTMAPEVANIASLTLMGFGLLVLVFVPDARSVLRQPAIAVSLAAGLVLLVALAITARTPTHIIVIMVLAPLWLAGPHAGMLSRLKHHLTPLTIASLALAGAAGGAAIASFDVLVLHQSRGGYLVNNPIHLADLSLMLGFVAMVGLLDRRPIRYIFLLGPVLALITVWFSGSRGPLVAFVPMMVVSSAVLTFQLGTRRTAMIATTLVVVAIAAAAFLVVGLGLGGRLAKIGELGSVMLTGSASDNSTNERIYMYHSAWNAFLASPWFGHGMVDFTAIAGQYAPPGNSFPPSGHLHNDLADFAVIGGGLGLLSYTLLLVAPIAGGFVTRGANRNPAIYLGIMAALGYLAMGMTNAMFGVLTQTVVYGVLLALVAALDITGRGDTT